MRRTPRLKVRKRMRDFLQLYAATGFDQSKKIDCAVKAGYARSGASHMADRALDHPVFREVINKELDRQGILNPDRIINKLDQLLECRHPFRPNMPDNTEQRKTAEMVLKLGDAFPPKKVDINKREVRYDLTPEDKERLDKVDWGDDKAVDAEVIEEEELLEPL